MSLLEGIKVVELGLWVAGPATAGILADWGADVVKVEARGGDPMRNIFGALGYRADRPNPAFELDNRGKRSIVLDLATPPGLDAMHRLLERADVFVTNVRPAALERLALHPAALAERHPRLVVASITGFGSRGPDRDRPGYDVGAFWARSGLARTIAAVGEPPTNLRSGIGDHVTAMSTVSGILAALVSRERTGRGRIVETSLLRTGMYCMGWDLGIQLAFGKLEPTFPRHESRTPLVNSYRAADDRWFWLLGLEADRHWPGLLRAIGRPDFADDERFRGSRERKRNSAALIAILDEVFAAEPLATWTGRFDAEDVWWAAAPTIAEVVDDPQAIAAGAFVEIGEGSPSRAVATPVTFDGKDRERFPSVPALGADTDEVLRELGYSDEEISSLRATP